jgi:hypothetical protein
LKLGGCDFQNFLNFATDHFRSGQRRSAGELHQHDGDANAWRIIRIIAVISRRRPIASADRSPWRHLPLHCPCGAPGEPPPCIRHLAFPDNAGPQQGVPRRVRAPQRGQDCASGSVVLQCGRRPSPNQQPRPDRHYRR